MAVSESALIKRLDDTVQMRKLIHPKHWRNESTLMVNRWFDYRFMSPLELTLLFGRLYVDRLRQHVRRNMDVSLAETVNGTKAGVPLERVGWFTALWLARQRADEFFLPYDLYLEFSFEFSSRRTRRWTMLPSQLHPSDRNKEAWLSRFDEFYEDRISHEIRRAGAIPHYRLENDMQLPAQLHFREIMLSEMGCSSRSFSDEIAERVYAKRHLDLSSALGVVPVDDRNSIATRAQSNFNDGTWEQAPVEKLRPSELLPSCFGISEAINVSTAPCSSCPLANKCAEFGKRAMAFTERVAGSASPVWEADKKRSARNTAACRRRKVIAEADASTTGAS